MNLPVVGYRLWIARTDEQVLTSLTDDTPWPVDGVVEADRDPDDVREWRSPGIHFYHRFNSGSSTYDMRQSHELWFTIERLYRTLHSKPDHHWVAGAIVAWGRTTLHELGGRAKCARLVALHYMPSDSDRIRARAYDEYDPTHPPPDLQKLARKYRVPLTTTPHDLHCCATEHGRELYEEDLVA